MKALRAATFLSPAERDRVALAVSEAERLTSGEIRVHLEDRTRDEPLDRAALVFERLGMQRTRGRNGVLIYVSVGDRKAAVIGDEGISSRVPERFWNDVLGVMQLHFAAGRRADGLCEAVRMVGEKLKAYHPHEPGDRDELPNEVSVG